MKKLSILIFLLNFFFISFGQTIPKNTETGKYQYDEIVPSEGLIPSDVYERAKNWIKRTLKTSDNNIQLDDVNKTSLITTGNIPLKKQAGMIVKYNDINLNFKFSVMIKEGRYRIVVDNFVLDYIVQKSGSNNVVITEPRTSPLEEGFQKEGLVKGEKQAEKANEEADEKIKKLIAELKIAVGTGVISGDKKDW